MSRKTNRIPFAVIGLLLFTMLGGAMLAGPESAASSPLPFTSSSARVDELEVPALPEVSPEEKLPELPVAGANAETGDPWKDFPNVCETFTAHQGRPKYNKKLGKRVAPINYQRNRYKYTLSDQKRTRDVIRLVAREMGVTEPDLFVAMALHESSAHPEAVHILNGDLNANRKAWDRHDYTPAKEAALKSRMQTHKGDFWKARGALNTLMVYKDNPHWRTRIQFDLVIPDQPLPGGKIAKGKTLKDSRGVWQFGYGLYGHNAVLFTSTWDRNAPPWVLCSHQGVIATIVEVWAARSAANECAYLTAHEPKKYGTEGATYLGVLRRLATGRCSDRPLRSGWQTLLKAFGEGSNPMARGGAVPWKSKASFGSKWDEKTTDRQEILAHMLRRIEEEGLLRPQPLERKKESSEPVLVATR